MRIVICGSVAFAQKIMDVKEKVEAKGFEVVIPQGLEDYLGDTKWKKMVSKDWNVENASEGAQRKIEGNLIKGYYDEISNSDAILVINEGKNGISNYIGGNSFLEMGFAHVLGKPIYLLNSISQEQQSIYQEVVAMQPIVIDNDLSKIS